MSKLGNITIEDLKNEIARRISEYALSPGEGSAGTLEISLRPSVARTFRAHWTGYRLLYPQPTLVLLAWLHDGSFWSEGYISTAQPSYVLAFRKTPHKNRGTGAERPDDKFSSPQSIETAIGQRREWVLQGLAPDEEIMRYEDFDDPMEAIDQFFNYTSLYCLRAVDLDWSSFGYMADPSAGWDEGEAAVASTPFDAAIEEGLKKSDILWLSPDTDPDKSIPCWFLYRKDKRLFVISAPSEQVIPDAARVRTAHIVTRRKGRDARMTEFDAHVRVVTPANRDEFDEIAEQLVAKRQSVRSSEEMIAGWKAEGVILELMPLA
jgi:hypothetical protein